MSKPIVERLKGLVNEVSDMKHVFEELMFFQLGLIEVVDKQTKRTLQSIRATRKHLEAPAR